MQLCDSNGLVETKFHLGSYCNYCHNFNFFNSINPTLCRRNTPTTSATWQCVAEEIGIIRSNATINQVWDQKDCTTEKQVKSGIYSVTFGYHISNLKTFRIID